MAEDNSVLPAFKMRRSRGFAFTVNNWTSDDWESLKDAQFRYLVMEQEVAKSGTPHIQGFVWFSLQKEWSAAVGWFKATLGHPRAHVESAYASALHNKKYCRKDETTFFERGECPLTDKQKGDMEKDRAKRNMEAVLEKRYEDVDDDVLAHQLRNYEYGAAALKRARHKATKLDGVLDNYWVYGDAGAGKDDHIEELIGDRPFYVKNGSNKWWCDYDFEDDVWIRDVGKRSREVIDLIKAEWCDRRPFRGEVKGGNTGLIRPKRVYISSNYHPDELYDEKDAAAIRRRFQIVHAVDGDALYQPRENIERPAPLRKIMVAPHPTPDPPSPDRFGLYLLD